MRTFWNERKARQWIASLATAETEDAERGEKERVGAVTKSLYDWSTAFVEEAEEQAAQPSVAAAGPKAKAARATASVERSCDASRSTEPDYDPLDTTPKIQLSAEQQEAKRLAVQGGSSLLITGGAGTGKSVLIREIVKAFQSRNYEIAVTATTGIAGLNIQGSTLHSWAGIGQGNGTPAMMATKITAKRDLCHRWRSVDVLVIDEVSMLDALLFDKLEAVSRMIRKDPRPFGSIQLILCGDFFQLPPVVLETRTNGHLDPELEQKKAYLLKRGSYRSNFVFDALTWHKCIPHTIALQRVFRQTEKELIHHLDCLRRGRVDGEIARFFAALDRPIDCTDGIMPTELFSRKREVEAANLAQLHALHGFPYRFKAEDTVNPECLRRIGDEERARYAGIYLSELKRSTIAPDSIELRAGAQVMLTKNLTNGLVNGSVGVIVGFVSTQDHKVAKDHNGNLWFRRPGSKGRVQIAQSATGSKNRTITDIAAEIGEGKKANATKAKAANIEIRATALPLFATRIREINDDSLRPDRKWPLVRFSKGLAKDETIEMLVTSMPFDFESAVTGNTVAMRQQVPLILAWAMSIHKGQGQTLPRVKVNLGSVFESGQAYVALSRATCIEGLQVINFSPEKIFAEECVVEWYQELDATQGIKSDPVAAKAGGAKVEDDDIRVDDDVEEKVVEIKREEFKTATGTVKDEAEAIAIEDSQREEGPESAGEVKAQPTCEAEAAA